MNHEDKKLIDPFPKINIDIPLLFRINVCSKGLFLGTGLFVSFDLDTDSKLKSF